LRRFVLFYNNHRGGKTIVSKKKIATLSILFALTCLLAIFILTPGMMIGGIRDIAPDDNVMIMRFSRYRSQVTGAYTDTVHTEYMLDAARVAMLRDLLRDSWYRRVLMPRSMHMLPQHAHSNYWM